MKKAIFSALLLACSVVSFAQKVKKRDVPAFGKVDKSELEMKTCDFDPKAEAEVLFDVGELNCLFSNDGVDLELVRHVRIKVLEDRGKNVADVKIPYHSYQQDESIRDLEAQTYNLDAAGNIVVTKVDKKSIFDKALNKRYSEKVFSFPEVRAGSVIEYRFKLTGAGLIDWYFQRSIPVRYSYFALDFPREIEIHSTPRCARPFEHSEEHQSTRNIETFSMSNVPALRDEPYILNDDDYLERVETRPIAVTVSGQRVSLVGNWIRIIRDLLEDEDFGLQLKKDIPRTADLDAQLQTLKRPYDKMVAVHNYVRTHMTWNGYEGIWALDGIKSAWKDKKGTVGEINLILINLLKDAGLTAYPILVSTHDHGLVQTAEAGYAQFNKVLAYVVIGDRAYVLDATEKATPSYLIPADVLLNEGMVIEKIDTYQWGWKTLWDDKYSAKNSVITTGNIDEHGKLTGESLITSADYARIGRAEVARKGVKDFTEKYLTESGSSLQIDSVGFENMDNDTLPLAQHVKFSQELPASGEYRYFNANLFTGMEKNPFLAETRTSDIFYGTNQDISITGTFFIPEGYVIEGLPKNVKMIMPDTSVVFSRICQSDDVGFYVNLTIQFRKPFYPASQYDDFREFYKKMEDMLNEQFVIRKKS